MASHREEQFCTFLLGDLSFGIEVLEVQEVLREQPVTVVPLAPGMVQGLINLRGEIVTAIDFRQMVGMATRPEDMPTMNVVVRTPEGPVCMLVDDIGDVLDLSWDAFEDAPETLPAGLKNLIRGVIKLDDDVMLVLDTARVAEYGPAVNGATH